MASVQGFGEYALHAAIFRTLRRDGRGSGLGDDCAVLDLNYDELLLVNIDKAPTVASESAELAQLLVAQAVSDIVCMGGTPLGIMPALTVPPHWSVDKVVQLIDSISREADRYGVEVVGGDTKEGSKFSAVTCAIGTVPRTQLIRRSGGNPGDSIVVTKTAGEPWGRRWLSYLLPLIASEDSRSRQTSRSSVPITLPTKESWAIRDSHGATSGLDLSDGLGAGCRLLAIASGLDVHLHKARVDSLVDRRLAEDAKTLGIRLEFLAYSPGYMWENLYTIAPDLLAAAKQAVRMVGGEIVEIGTLEEGLGEVFLDDDSAAPELNLASDEKFQAVPGGQLPATWLARARKITGHQPQ